MSHDDEIKAVIASPSTSYWLRNALEASLQRDCVDAANDAEMMHHLLTRRCSVIHGEV